MSEQTKTLLNQSIALNRRAELCAAFLRDRADDADVSNGDSALMTEAAAILREFAGQPMYAPNLECPCGNALKRDGETVKSHWLGAICANCEADIFAKYNSRPVSLPLEGADDGK